MIQKHSTVEHDYLSNGFWAYKYSEELPNPGITASILQRMEDVTDQVNAVLNDNMSEEERAAAIDAISKQISAKAYKELTFKLRYRRCSRETILLVGLQDLPRCSFSRRTGSKYG